jgi:hypothetical protein
MAESRTLPEKADPARGRNYQQKKDFKTGRIGMPSFARRKVVQNANERCLRTLRSPAISSRGAALPPAPGRLNV